MITKSLRRGLSLVRQLWYGLLAAILTTACIGMCASILLPYDLVKDQTLHVSVPYHGQQQNVSVQLKGEGVQVPTVMTQEQYKKLVVPVSVLFMLSMAFFLYLLGGVLGSSRRLLREESASPNSFLRDGARWFFPLVGWANVMGFIVFVITLGSGSVLAVMLGGRLLNDPHGPELAGMLPVALFRFLFLIVSALFLFSPVVLVEKNQGVLKSFWDGLIFLFRHFWGTVLLFLAVAAVGVVVMALGFPLAALVNSIREFLHIPPYSKGISVFFFSLILGIPQSILAIFFPAALYAYYVGTMHDPTTSVIPPKSGIDSLNR